jgi:hypothetical protein
MGEVAIDGRELLHIARREGGARFESPADSMRRSAHKRSATSKSANRAMIDKAGSFFLLIMQI